MRILFHGPGMAVHRPALRFPHLTGVQPVVVDRLSGLRESQRLTSNRGNIIHAEAPARLFRKDPDQSAYGNIATVHRALGDRFEKRMAESFDMIVLSLANFIRPNVDSSALLEPMKALQGKVPFIVLGAGLQGKSKFSDLAPSTQELLRFFHENALVFGVRGKLTENWLHANGLTKAEALGCPSLYTFPQSLMAIDGQKARAKGGRVDIMSAGYLTQDGGHNFQRGVKLARALEGRTASYVFQDEFMKYGAFADETFSFNEGTNTANAERLNSVFGRETGIPVNFQRYYYFTESSAWRQACQAHDVYIGDRFHGGVAALQAGQPAIFLCQDNRVAELCDFFSLPRLSIDEFARKGLEKTLDEHLSEEILQKMKSTYRERSATFRATMERHGLMISSSMLDM